MLAANSFRPVNQIEFTLFLLAPQYEHVLFRVPMRNNEIITREEAQKRGLRADQVEVCPERVIEQEAVPVAAAATPAPATPASAAVEVPAVGGPIIEYGLQMAKRGIRIHPLWPKTKLPILKEWETKATTDEATIRHWAAQYPGCNYGPVAYPDGIWLFESDDPSVLTRIEMETGNELPDTFTVESRPGRQHFYFKQTESSRRMGNLAQGFVRLGDFSVRQNKQFCVGPGSLHPVTGEPYKIVSASEIVEAPEWFIKWLLDQKIQPKKTVAASPDTSEIPSGQRNATLASIAGKFRANGASYDVILAHLTEVNQGRCNPPLPQKDVETIAGSISKYKAGNADPIYLGGKPLDESTTPVQTMGPKATDSDEPRPAFETKPYPKFPHWVMQGTSLYKNFVKPWCDANPVRYEEFLFMPAVTLMLNYLNRKAFIELGCDPLSLYVLAIGRKGRVIKSGSFRSACNFFQKMGLSRESAVGSILKAEGKTLIWTAGSPEGLGLEMTNAACSNALLFYDELSDLAAKAGIENSSLKSKLLLWYESGFFNNAVKGKKEKFAISSGEYVVSLYACVTDRTFTPEWIKLGDAQADGLEDRFFFLLQPEKLKHFDELPPLVNADSQTNPEGTRKLIDKATSQQKFPIRRDFVQRESGGMTARQQGRVQKLALYFAVDLDKTEIDEDCIKRAAALIRYEMAVKERLSVPDAKTKEARVQMEFMQELKLNGGKMARAEVHNRLKPSKWGTTLWANSYLGLIKNGWIKESGAGTKGDPVIIELLRDPAVKEEE